MCFNNQFHKIKTLNESLHKLEKVVSVRMLKRYGHKLKKLTVFLFDILENFTKQSLFFVEC